MLRRVCLLLVASLTLGCGSSFSSEPSGLQSGPAATVVVNHTLFRGVLARVDVKSFSAVDPNGNVVYGPVRFSKAPSIRLEQVPVAATTLNIEYIDTDPDQEVVTGSSSAELQLAPGATVFVEEPLINLLVATTTLDRSIEIDDGTPYHKLRYGPAWAQQLREELAPAQSGREDRREAIMCIAHLSDIHLADSESPLRIEFLRHLTGFELPAAFFQGAWRPQETLLTHVAEAMVRQLNDLSAGPVTGRPYDFAISTGDNGDNRHQNELERFIDILDGASITPSSGNPDLYEGVQDSVSFDKQYWHPDPGPTDDYKEMYGFPDYPGLLQAAVVPFQAEGLNVPWYSVFGNHDYLLQGNFLDKKDLAPTGAVEAIATGDRKILDIPFFYGALDKLVAGSGVDLFLLEWIDPFGVDHDWPTFVSRWNALTTLSRTVTADSGRHILSRAEWIQAHLNSPASPGPVGHGFTAQNITDDAMYYSFEPVPGVLGITLDTVNPGGEADGSLGQTQVAWLEDQLKQVHSRYYDQNNNLVQTQNQDKLVVLFSHHHLATLTNPLPDPNNAGPRVLDGEFEAILHRYPNVILWLNGHSHYCRTFVHPDPLGRTGGFWEVNTPSHIDFPQQSRVVELVDNKDGTLSVFATLVDHAAPPETGPVTSDVLRLASINRELCANDPQVDLATQLGTLDDRNVELIIPAPFSLP